MGDILGGYIVGLLIGIVATCIIISILIELGWLTC